MQTLGDVSFWLTITWARALTSRAWKGSVGLGVFFRTLCLGGLFKLSSGTWNSSPGVFEDNSEALQGSALKWIFSQIRAMKLADKCGKLRVSPDMCNEMIAKRLDCIPDQTRTVQENPLCLWKWSRGADITRTITHVIQHSRTA